MDREQLAKVSSHKSVEAAIGKLATTMRLSAEAYFRSGDLSKVDREEAINNLELAFETKLEAFHSLYDVSRSLFAYHAHGDTALVIALRNAIHHRNHPLFRSLEARIFLEDKPARWQGAAFLTARHPASLGGPILMSHLLRLDDIDARLDPSLGSTHFDAFNLKMAAIRFETINGDLGLPAFREEALRGGYPKDQAYLDVMPIFISAVCRVFKAMQAENVRFEGFDAETYGRHFISDVAIDLSRLEYRSQRIPSWLAETEALDPAGEASRGDPLHSE